MSHFIVAKQYEQLITTSTINYLKHLFLK